MRRLRTITVLCVFPSMSCKALRTPHFPQPRHSEDVTLAPDVLDTHDAKMSQFCATRMKILLLPFADEYSTKTNRREQINAVVLRTIMI